MIGRSAARHSDSGCARCSQRQQQIPDHSWSWRLSGAQHGRLSGHRGSQAAKFRSPSADVFDNSAHHFPVGVRVDLGDCGGDRAERIEEHL
jgi:hypothetical protein